MDEDVKTPVPEETPRRRRAPEPPVERTETAGEAPAEPKADEVPVAPPVPPNTPRLPPDLHVRLKRRVLALQGPEVGEPRLSEQSAAILLAHLLMSHPDQDEVEHLGETELCFMAREFRRLHPIVWFPLSSGHLPGLQAAFDRSEIKANVAEYAELAALILSN